MAIKNTKQCAVGITSQIRQTTMLILHHVDSFCSNLHHLLLFHTGNLISNLRVDERGEVYVAKFDTGEIFKFVPVS